MVTAPRHRPLPRAVWLLVTARAVNRLGAFSLSFLTVLLGTTFRAGATTAGLLSALFGVATIPSRLVGGHLADRFGRRRTIVVGLVGCAVAQLGLATAGSLPVAAGFVILLGLVFELYEPPSQALVADTVQPADRVRAYGLLNAALNAAGLGAGLLAAALGRIDLRWLFVADAATCLTCALVVSLGLPADPPVCPTAGAEPLPDDEVGGARPWRDRTLVGMFATGTVYATVFMLVMVALPLSMPARGLPSADAGLLFTTAALTVLAGRPLARVPRIAALPTGIVLAVGYLVMAVGLAGYATAGTLPSLLAWTVVWSAGDLLLVGRAFEVVTGLAPPGATGRYLAAYGTSWGYGTVAAPLLATQLLRHAGVTALWLTTAGAILVLAVLQPLVIRVHRRGDRRPLPGLPLGQDAGPYARRKTRTPADVRRSVSCRESGITPQ
jgi:Major Facilitator Superfamily